MGRGGGFVMPTRVFMVAELEALPCARKISASKNTTSETCVLSGLHDFHVFTNFMLCFIITEISPELFFCLRNLEN